MEAINKLIMQKENQSKNTPSLHLLFLAVVNFSGDLGQGLLSYITNYKKKFISIYQHWTESVSIY